MAIFNIVGFETGDETECVSGTGTRSIQTSTVRTGTYAFRSNPTTSAVGHITIRGMTSDGVSTAVTAATGGGSFGFRYATKPASNAEVFFEWRTAANAQKLQGRITSTGVTQLFDAGGSQLGSDGTTVLTAGTWYDIDWKCGTSATVGAYELRINGVVEFTGTGNTSATAGALLVLGKNQNLNSNTVDFFYDDVILDDAGSYSLAAKIASIFTTANGSTMQWTGGTGSSDYTQVDEVPFNDADYVQSVNSGDVALFAMTDCVTAGIQGVIKAVKAYTRMRENTSGTSASAVRIRSGGTNSDSTNLNGSTSATVQCRVLPNDPATGAPWLTSAVDAVEMGGVENAALAERLTMVMGMVAYIDQPALGTPFGKTGQIQMTQLLAQ